MGEIINMEVFKLQAELQQNQLHLNDVRDAMSALTQEWDKLQEGRTEIINKLTELGE